MMVGNHEERSLVNSKLPKLHEDLFARGLGQGRNVMQRNDQAFHSLKMSDYEGLTRNNVCIPYVFRLVGAEAMHLCLRFTHF